LFSTPNSAPIPNTASRFSTTAAVAVDSPMRVRGASASTMPRSVAPSVTPGACPAFQAIPDPCARFSAYLNSIAASSNGAGTPSRVLSAIVQRTHTSNPVTAGQRTLLTGRRRGHTDSTPSTTGDDVAAAAKDGWLPIAVMLTHSPNICYRCSGNIQIIGN
jgi:hypothetical protein